ncbi:predicted protein [Pyrenophora tritici-repentis Pt-1C-BFP]|uniref:Retrotran-gag-2 domain-containing protein n=1 Tax=Pyrenophora tritici-repentis (strain Pt-1C-BFP) TaxID=426418 RepID=B2VY09_PYRTR|nr:uncharacterized protein PTRG_03397 [Pyrenophora tritici-repentis Pt-1C-BFP]EDU45920.1 predicted protein [Pyrenophora tritici-repentis Pt-1C-BFP]
MSTQFPDGNAADAPHVGDASGSDANPTAGATISPGKSARSFARPTVASTARSSALPRATGQPTLAAYEYDANGEPRLVGELDEAFVKGSTTEAGEKLYQFCFDTVHTLHNDLANLQERLTDAQEDLIDERVAKLNSEKQMDPLAYAATAQLPNLAPDAPLPATTQRRSKQPEPAVFEGPTGTKASTYQKWKLDMQSWFRAHPYPFANNEEEQLDYIRMKTTGVAWDNISSGWFVEGDEFHTAQEAWDILDACYGRLNTRLDAHNFYEKEGFMKPGETITSYLARFKAGVAPLKWDDEEKTLQAYKKLPDQWRSRAEHLMSDDTFTKDFAKFSHKLRHLEQLHSALQPSHNPSKGNSGGSGRGGGGNNRNRNRNADNAQPKGSGANQFIINKPYRERTVMETQVLAELERCFKCTRAGHKSNSDDAPCKDMDKLTSMGRYPEVLTALNEARKAAGVPIPKAAVRINAVRAPTPPAAASDARSENE